MFPSTVRRLEVFIAAADAGSFSAAAEQLGISQPSVSGHIRALERYLDQKLFERRRGASSLLTEHGRRLYEYGTDLLSQIRHMRSNLGLGRHPSRARRVVVTVQRTLANYRLAEPLASFARRHPETELVVNVGRYEEVLRELLDGHAHLGIFLARGRVLDLSTEIIGREEFGLLASRSHPLARRKRIAPDDIGDQPFVAPDRDSRYYQMVRRLLGSVGITDYPIAAEAQEFAIVKALVVEGLGITCAPLCSVKQELAKRELVQLSIDAPPIYVNVVQAYAPGHRPPADAVRLAKELGGVLRTS